MVITLPPVLLLIKNKPADKGLLSDGETALSEQAQQSQVSRYVSTKEVLRDRSFWYVGISVGILFLVFSALTNNLASFG